MNVFVTGGTGFVGRHVVRSLCAEGHSVRLLARRPESVLARKLVLEGEVDLCGGDVLEAASLIGILGRVGAVIHLVGIISECGPVTFDRVHVRATENMLAAAKEQGVQRFIQMSALGTRPGAASKYHQTKWAAEELVRNSGLNWTIFRPSLIYGSGDHLVNLFARISRFVPVLPVVGRREARFQPVSVQNVAKAFVGALRHATAVGQGYDVCGEERKSLAEIVDDILTVLGRRRLKLHVPSGLARVQASVLEWFFPRVLGRAAPLSRDQLIMLDEGSEGDGVAANRLFGLRHRSFRDGIRTYLRPTGAQA